MDENTPDWLVKAADETDAVVRKVMPIVRAAQQYMEDARAALADAGPSLPPARELALAMDTGMRELIAAVRGQAEHRTVYGSAIGYASGIVTATGHAIRAPMILAEFGEAGAATDTLTVSRRDDSPADVGMPLDAKTVFLAIIWVFAILLPLKIGELPPDVQTIIRDYLVTVGTALIIHWRVTDSRKR
jgi:hypothetical protein